MAMDHEFIGGYTATPPTNPYASTLIRIIFVPHDNPRPPYEVLTIEADEGTNTTIQEVKAKIQHKIGVPAHNQLIQKIGQSGVNIEDERTLRYYGIANNQSLYCIQAPPLLRFRGRDLADPTRLLSDVGMSAQSRVEFVSAPPPDVPPAEAGRLTVFVHLPGGGGQLAVEVAADATVGGLAQLAARMQSPELSGGRVRKGARGAPAPPGPPPAPPARRHAGPGEELTRLFLLHLAGALSAAQFRAAKAAVLAA